MTGGYHELIAVRVRDRRADDRSARPGNLDRLEGDHPSPPADLFDRGSGVVVLEDDPAHGAGLAPAFSRPLDVHRENDVGSGKRVDRAGRSVP